MRLLHGPLPPRSLVAAIVGITVVPLATLFWVGWRLLDQDRILERQRAQDRLERAADLAVSAVQRAIASTEQRLAAGASDWPEGAVALRFEDGFVHAFPRERVAYLPAAPPLREAPPAVFAEGDELEFRRHNGPEAIRKFQELARSPDPATRAGALLRLARNLKNAGRIDDALAAYAQLSALDGVSAGSGPAGLVARYARCKLFEESRRTAELRAEAERLAGELQAVRWPLTAPVYWLYAEDAARWTGRPARQSPFADAAAALAPKAKQWQGSGRESLKIGGRLMTVLWQSSPASARALVAAPEFVASQWLARQPGVHLGGLTDAAAATTPKAVRGIADTGLPWSLVVTASDPPGADRELVVRRRLLIGGFLLLLSMALVAGYVIFRAISRELAVACLQSDFVSAVSHEFRTPLTALRQFTDMLRDGGSLTDERRRLCYDAQSRATDRLTRLVESLLDFGRMQAGVQPYRFERHDCGDVVEHAVDDFRRHAQAAAHEIEFHRNGAADMELDSEALSRAVWNLLENAVKYSPAGPSVEVGLERCNGSVRIAVRDRGIGIPAHEQSAIFARFRRGEEARRLGIKGTGIGLAMVDQIVKAHQGRVELESRPGQGSTFTIVLPVKEA